LRIPRITIGAAPEGGLDLGQSGEALSTATAAILYIVAVAYTRNPLIFAAVAVLKASPD